MERSRVSANSDADSDLEGAGKIGAGAAVFENIGGGVEGSCGRGVGGRRCQTPRCRRGSLQLAVTV